VGTPISTKPLLCGYNKKRCCKKDKVGTPISTKPLFLIINNILEFHGHHNSTISGIG
jgi:hypothetical protein